MALKVNASALAGLPGSLEGSYLFPFEWFVFGMDHGHIEIEDLAFYDTIQGSVYLALMSSDAPVYLNGNNVSVPVWYVYKSGSGEVTPVVDQEVIRSKGEISLIQDSYLKAPVIYCSVERMSRLGKNDQKTVNNSIIQLFKGCNVRLNHSVWF